MYLEVEVPGAAKLAQDCGNAASAVNIFNVVGPVGRYLGQAGYAVGDVVDVIQREVHLAFLRGRQGVQDGIGGATHGHV